MNHAEGKFIVYRSSAGSGKTHNLVKTFLSLALGTEDPSRYRSILAITFTNKAANEMKARVVESLYKIQQGTDFPMGTQVLHELNITKEDLEKRATNTLNHLLHHYSDLSISTIDKFVHRIISSFARDLNVPMDFEIEVEETEILEQAIGMLIAKAGVDKDLTRTLIDFTETKAAEEKSWHIENDILNLARRAMDEEGFRHLEKIKGTSIQDILSIRKDLLEKTKAFEKRVSQIGKKGVDLIEQKEIDPAMMAQGKKAGIWKYFTYLRDVRSDKLQPSSTIQNKVIGEDKWVAGKADVETADKIMAIKGDLTELYEQAVELIGDEYPEYLLNKLIIQNLYALALINEIDKQLREIKEENDLLLISDLNKLISAIVLNEPAPFIYERIGNRYKDLLVDEFQDTSIMQWQNLLPLVENSLSMGNTTLLVGDGKQAIYRWRNGDVEQFQRLPQIETHQEANLEEKQNILQENHQQVELVTNRRSCKEIVEFNNTFFRTLSNQLQSDLQSIYQDVEQSVPEEGQKDGGYIYLEAIPEDDKQKYTEITLEKTLLTVKDLLSRGYEKKDIAILTRTNKKGSEISEHLMENGIDVISSESLLLKKSDKVNFLIALLEYLLDDQNDECKVVLFDFILKEKGKSDQYHRVLSQYAHPKQEGKRFVYLDAFTFLKDEGYGDNLGNILQAPLYEAFEKMIRTFHLAQESEPYLQFFLDHVRQFTSKHGNDPVYFLKDWEHRQEKISISIPEGAEAVEVMTLHKCKGLQFPAVIMPFASWEMQKGKDQLWIDLQDRDIPLSSTLVPMRDTLKDTALAEAYQKEKDRSLLDDFNLLYVGMTRPEEQLYLFTGPPKGKSIAKHLHAALNDLEEEFASNLIMERGEPALKMQVTSGGDAPLELQRTLSSDWKDKLRISRQAPTLWNIEAPEAKSEYGNLIHGLLSRIKTIEDVPQVLDQFQNDGSIDRATRKEVEKKLHSLFSDSKIKALFKPADQIKTEAELLDPSGVFLRPDRVVINGKKATIVDHKTGEYRKEHEQQVNRYAKQLEAMGYEEVQQFLLYFEDQQLISLNS